MYLTKQKLKNISKNQSELSGQRVFYIRMSENQAGNNQYEISDLRELPVWYKQCKYLTLTLYFQLTWPFGSNCENLVCHCEFKTYIGHIVLE